MQNQSKGGTKKTSQRKKATPPAPKQEAPKQAQQPTVTLIGINPDKLALVQEIAEGLQNSLWPWHRRKGNKIMNVLKTGHALRVPVRQ